MVEQQALGVLFRRARAEVNAYFTDISGRERTVR
jgi:hypothetical protein